MVETNHPNGRVSHKVIAIATDETIAGANRDNSGNLTTSRRKQAVVEANHSISEARVDAAAPIIP
jgi:hypothetical protein